MANKFLLVPEDIFRGLTTATDSGNISLDFTKRAAENARRQHANATIRNVNYQQNLRRYLHLRHENDAKPINVAVTGADPFAGALVGQPIAPSAQPPSPPPPPSNGGPSGGRRNDNDNDDDHKPDRKNRKLLPPPRYRKNISSRNRRPKYVSSTPRTAIPLSEFARATAPVTEVAGPTPPFTNVVVQPPKIEVKKQEDFFDAPIPMDDYAFLTDDEDQPSTFTNILQRKRTTSTSSTKHQKKEKHERKVEVRQPSSRPPLPQPKKKETKKQPWPEPGLEKIEQPIPQVSIPDIDENWSSMSQRKRSKSSSSIRNEKKEKPLPMPLTPPPPLPIPKKNIKKEWNWPEPGREEIEQPDDNLSETERKIKNILRIINGDPSRYNVNGGRIFDLTGKPIGNSNLDASLQYLINGRSGERPPGTSILENRLMANPDIMQHIPSNERGVKRKNQNERKDFIAKRWTFSHSPHIESTVAKKSFKWPARKITSNITAKKSIKWAPVKPTAENIKRLLTHTEILQKRWAQIKPTPENIQNVLEKTKNLKWAKVKPTPENIRRILAQSSHPHITWALIKPTPANIARALRQNGRNTQ